MLVFVDVRVDPKGMTQDELWEAWEEEDNAALAAKDAGTVVNLYKVCGQRRVLVLLDVESHDELDQIWMATLRSAPVTRVRDLRGRREAALATADGLRRVSLVISSFGRLSLGPPDPLFTEPRRRSIHRTSR